MPAPIPALAFDPDRMEQVLSNLIGNALKFSPPGAAVTVRIVLEGGEVFTRVIDRGPGIPPDERRRIFDPFVRGSVQPPDARKGTGLGLAISRRIVKAHGGRIGVEETAGGGTTLWFSLPPPGRTEQTDGLRCFKKPATRFPGSSASRKQGLRHKNRPHQG